MSSASIKFWAWMYEQLHPHKTMQCSYSSLPKLETMNKTPQSVPREYFGEKSTCGCVRPLGWPRSVYKSDVERQCLAFWVEMAKWPWRSRSMTPIFNTSRENPMTHLCCKVGDSNSNPLQVIMWTSWISKWPKWPWRSRSMTSIFNTSREYPMIHGWFKFGDSRWNLWWIIV